MNEVVFMLPNGRLSNGNYVRKFTKAQLRAARVIARIPADCRESMFRYIDMLDEKNGKPRPLVPSKY